MTEDNKNSTGQTLDDTADIPGAGAGIPGAEKNAKERLYDKIPLTARQLDIIIIALAVAFVVFMVIGALVGNGYLPK